MPDISGIDCELLAKEIIPAGGTAQTRVGGAGNAAGDNWYDFSGTKALLLQIVSISWEEQDRIMTSHDAGSNAPNFAHGPRTCKGSIRARAFTASILEGAYAGSDKIGTAGHNVISYRNQVKGDGTGFYDGNAGTPAAVSNLPTIFAELAFRVKRKKSDSVVPITDWFNRVNLSGRKAGFAADGVEEVAFTFEASLEYGEYKVAGY